MTQSDIFDYLKKQRLKGNDEYISVEKVEKYLKRRKQSLNRVGVKLLKLHHWGYLEIKVKPKVKGKYWHGWNRSYRIKMRYLKNGL